METAETWQEEQPGEHISMYKVKRDGGTVTVLDEDGKQIYTGDSQSFIIYRLSSKDMDLDVSKIKDLSDEQLLLALATAVRLSGF